jgi:hypothetical protein
LGQEFLQSQGALLFHDPAGFQGHLLAKVVLALIFHDAATV